MLIITVLFLMNRAPPKPTRPATLFPYTSLFRSPGGGAGRCRRIEAAPLQHLRFRAPRATAARIMTDTHDLRAEALVSKAWPYEEARKLLKRYPSGKPGGAVLFETGYGPSGLPHIGTFNEVLRTTMVRDRKSTRLNSSH